MNPAHEMLLELRNWVMSRIEAEVTHRPDVNIYKRTLSETWDQVLREINRRLEDFEGSSHEPTT